MAINQLNLFDSVTERNLSNMSVNVDYNRLAKYMTEVEPDFTSSPAVMTVKVGSFIEVNGNLYVVQTSDEEFTMDNSLHNYLTVTDDGGTVANPLTFGSSSTIGTFDAKKQGYYQADGVTKTMKYYVDQPGETLLNLLDVQNGNQVLTTKSFDRIKVNTTMTPSVNTVIPFDTVVYDELGRWDNVNYQYVAVESGYFLLNLQYGVTAFIGSAYIRVDSGGGPVNKAMAGPNTSGGIDKKGTRTLEYLNKGDIVDFYFLSSGSVLDNASTATFAEITRLL